MPANSNVLKCLPACKNQLFENMIDKDFADSDDDTGDEYESDNIGDDNAWNLRNQYSLDTIGVS